MVDKITLEIIKDKIELVEAEIFGEVRVIVQNGAVYRVLKTDDTFMKDAIERRLLDKKE